MVMLLFVVASLILTLLTAIALFFATENEQPLKSCYMIAMAFGYVISGCQRGNLSTGQHIQHMP